MDGRFTASHAEVRLVVVAAVYRKFAGVGVAKVAVEPIARYAVGIPLWLIARTRL